jgi:hypothetical protein
MKSTNKFNNLLFLKGVNDHLSNFFPLVSIEKRVEQFLNLLIVNFLEKIVTTSCKLIHHRKGRILQRKDLIFFIYLGKKTNFPNSKFFEKKILKKKKKKINN